MNENKTFKIGEKEFVLQMPATSWILSHFNANDLSQDNDNQLNTVSLIIENAVVKPSNIGVDDLSAREALELRQKAVSWFFGFENKNNKGKGKGQN